MVGYNLWGVHIARRIVRVEHVDVVMEAIDGLFVTPKSCIMLYILDLNAKKKKGKMHKDWNLFKKSVEKKNKIDELLAFVNANPGLFSEENVCRMLDNFEGVGFLYHQF